MRKSALPGCAWQPRDQARDAISPVYTTGLAGLLQPLDHRRIVCPVVAHSEAVPGLIHAPTGLGEQLARDRRLPAGSGLPRRDVQHSTRRFRRRGRHPSATPGSVVRVVVLLGPVEIELVTRRGLPRQPDRCLALQAVIEGLLGSIEVHRPGIRVAGVLVLEHARHRPSPLRLGGRRRRTTACPAQFGRRTWR